MATSTLEALNQTAVRQRRLKLEEVALVALFAVITFDHLYLFGTNLLGLAQVSATGVRDVTLPKLATLAALGAWAARGLLSKDHRLFSVLGSNLSSIFVWAFIAVSILSNIAVTNADSFPWASPWDGVARRVQLAALFFICVAIIQRRKIMHYVILAYLLGGLLTCGAACYEMMTGEQFLDVAPGGRTEIFRETSGEVRAQGLHDDADQQAIFLLLGIAFLPYLWHCAKGYLKIGALLVAAMYVVSAFGTGSKGCFVSIAVIFLTYLILMRGRGKWKIAAVLSLLGVAAFVGVGLSPNVITVDKFRGVSSGANTTRLGLIYMAWEIGKDHPILGAGTGSFPFVYHRYFPTASALVPSGGYPVLNSYAQIWAENGAIGVVILLLLLGAVLLELSSALRNVTDSRSKMLGLAMLVAHVCFLWLMIPYPVLRSKYMWLGMGMAIAYSNVFGRQPQGVPVESTTAPGIQDVTKSVP